MREFFVLHRMVGRTQRGVLTPGYFEPCSFPSKLLEVNVSDLHLCLVIVTGKERRLRCFEF